MNRPLAEVSYKRQFIIPGSDTGKNNHVVYEKISPIYKDCCTVIKDARNIMTGELVLIGRTTIVEEYYD